MDEEQKKKLFEGFKKVEPQDFDNDYWTEERLLITAKKVKFRLGLKEELATVEDLKRDGIYTNKNSVL